MTDAAGKPKEVERYSFTERLCHWITGLTYLYCLLTGLAFYTPYLYWLAIVLGGGATSRFFHPWIGLAFFACQMWMHSLWNRDMSITAADREWEEHVRDYAENHDERVPKAGRFNAGQKLFYWVMYYGAIALLITGLVMWFPELLPASLSWLRAIMIVIHAIAALVTIGGFIIHVYMGVFFIPGGLRGIVQGHVPKSWAKAHHELWYDSLQEK